MKNQRNPEFVPRLWVEHASATQNESEPIDPFAAKIVECINAGDYEQINHSGGIDPGWRLSIPAGNDRQAYVIIRPVTQWDGGEIPLHAYMHAGRPIRVKVYFTGGPYPTAPEDQAAIARAYYEKQEADLAMARDAAKASFLAYTPKK